MKHKTDLAAAAAAGAAVYVLLRHSALAGAGISRGLGLCGQTLIPSLFPFMALAMLVSRSAAARPLAGLLGPACRRWLRLTAGFGPVLLLSLIGGYPVGARMLAGMIDRGEATPAQAEDLLCFAVCPAPSFAVVTVGAGLLGSTRAGLVLYGCHLLAGLLLGLWQARKRQPPPQNAAPDIQVLPLPTALVEATAAAVEGMLAICGTVLVFSILLALAEGLGLTAALARFAAFAAGGKLAEQTAAAALGGLLEVTCGLAGCHGLSAAALCVLAPFLVSFGSFSVVCQLAACLGGRGVSLRRLINARLAHALLCTLLAAPLLWRLQPHLAAFAQPAQPLGQPAPVILSTLALLGMCSLFLLALEPSPIAPQKPTKICQKPPCCCIVWQKHLH